MRISTWAYPWDVSDIGVDRVVGFLAELGVSSLSIAVNYHAISTFSPSNERRPVFYTTRGGVYFPARRRRYSNTQPLVTEDTDVAAVHEALRKRTDAEGMELFAWVIGRFQPWFVEDYPHTGIVDALGGRPQAQPCASNEEYESFLLELVEDYCDQFSPDRIQLESPGYSGFADGWVRERILHPIPDPVQIALGLCFCPSCLARYERSGVDAERARDDIRDFIRGGLCEPPTSEATVPWLAEIRQARREVMRRLLRRMASIAGAHGTQFDCEGALPAEPPSGLDAADVVELCDGIVLPNPSHLPHQATQVSRHVIESSTTTNRIVTVEGGEYLSADDPGRARILRDVRVHNPDIVTIYNFGLLTPQAFGEIARDLST